MERLGKTLSVYFSLVVSILPVYLSLLKSGVLNYLNATRVWGKGLLDGINSALVIFTLAMAFFVGMQGMKKSHVLRALAEDSIKQSPFLQNKTNQLKETIMDNVDEILPRIMKLVASKNIAINNLYAEELEDWPSPSAIWKNVVTCFDEISYFDLLQRENEYVNRTSKIVSGGKMSQRVYSPGRISLKFKLTLGLLICAGVAGTLYLNLFF